MGAWREVTTPGLRESRWANDVSRGRSLARALKVLFRLQSGRQYSLAELAVEHRVSPRTIRRDIYSLEEAGVPVVHDDRAGEWSVMRSWTFTGWAR